MPNIATLLKDEISRLARKHIRGEITGLKKAAATYRTEIAALKRRTLALEQGLSRQKKATPKADPAAADEEGATAVRFSAKGLASQRRRLGLSADDCGLLVGASGQSVYNWEAGKARPRTGHLTAIASLKRMGKKEAARRIAEANEA
jgi:DNA-binding transcriptional regulator YiaG